MSLESAEWRERGAPPPPSVRPPTVGDRLARAVAFLILVVIFAGSVFLVSFATYGIPIVMGFLVVGLVFCLFRVRELRRRLEDVERARAPAREPEPSEPSP